MKITWNAPYITAQLAHVGWGLGIPLWFANHHQNALGFALGAIIAIGKESLESLGLAPWEARQPWSDSLIDMAFFGVGIGIAALSYL